ncbi:hypothetical protein C6497_12075 [Candidatus Poribacteria bacterium]|nr:MAG: hypothetical protein C6497_12075 [Candidatus Poribacteria bacterium]
MDQLLLSLKKMRKSYIYFLNLNLRHDKFKQSELILMNINSKHIRLGKYDMATLFVKGFVRDVKYTPCFNPEKFQVYNLANFDVNKANSFGLVNLGISENNLAYSKWVSTKRTYCES